MGVRQLETVGSGGAQLFFFFPSFFSFLFDGVSLTTHHGRCDFPEFAGCFGNNICTFVPCCSITSYNVHRGGLVLVYVFYTYDYVILAGKSDRSGSCVKNSEP